MKFKFYSDHSFVDITVSDDADITNELIRLDEFICDVINRRVEKEEELFKAMPVLGKFINELDIHDL